MKHNNYISNCNELLLTKSMVVNKYVHVHTCLIENRIFLLFCNRQKYPDMETIVCDLSDWDQTRTTFEGISDIDMLVNNAGVDRITSFLDISKEDIDR